MNNLPSSPMHSRLLLPEMIWLEPEQIEQAKTMSKRAASEPQQWEAYLNALALLGFEQWLNNRLPEQAIARLPKPIESVHYLEVGGFTICLIAVEQVLDETVRIPQTVLEQPELAAHFYVLHEVSEEQELVTVRGFCRYDELMNSRRLLSQRWRDRDSDPEAGDYLLPLALLDAEPNHLLFYCRSLRPAAIALPTATPAVDHLFGALSTQTTRLAQWLQGAFDESWQAIDQLMHPDAAWSLSTRSLESGARRGKLINLGVQLGQQAVALLVNVTSDVEGKLGVLVQLHPTGSARYLSPDLKLSLRSRAGKTLQEVTARSQDNYIQLKPVKGKPGTRFSITIQLGNETVEENFEL